MADTVKGVEIDPVREKLVELLENDYCPLLYVLGDSVGTLADYLIAHGVTVQEWTSVKDRLPEPGVRVLATDEEFVGEFYINKRGQWQRYNVNDVALLMALDILWWKPLPQPPKGE
jgi:hypothetical protein